MRLPDKSQRLVVIGKTGEGKSTVGLYFLCQMDWDETPYVFVDIKGDDLFAKILKACGKTIKRIDYNTVPTKGGLYYLKVDMFDMEGLEQWLVKVYQQGNVGLFIDEGYAIPKMSKAFTAILTQGRAKNIPVIVLYQRPVYMSKFAIAQADFFVCLNQNMQSDKELTYEYVPLDLDYKGHRINVLTTLPRYCFLYYDVAESEIQFFKPVPHPNNIVKMFKDRLKPAPQSNRLRIYI